ncbi:MAG TPA: NAD(P)-dependent oxidoreductase [Abditibacteriaceae bacterium]|jgi:NAD(P)-dependent dehydrogenase (short-subunit alcohol dehydrogenase family)
MAHSFSATETGALAQLNETRRRVLVTGAAGNIGSYFASHSEGKYDLKLMIREGDDASEIEGLGEVVTGDLLDLEGLKTICEGIDTVVHMAGDPSPSATWQELLDANISGTYNIFVAAKAAGCRRVIHASSIHAVSGYPADVQVKTSEPVNPGDLYGVSKCFGEALGRYMAEKEGLSVFTLRIGAFQPIESIRKEGGLSMLDAWVSQRDLNQLINRCIDIENVHFAILHGLSDNRFKRLDISDARELVGYAPEDDSTAEHPAVKDLDLAGTLQSHSAVVDGQKSGIREEL